MNEQGAGPGGDGKYLDTDVKWGIQWTPNKPSASFGILLALWLITFLGLNLAFSSIGADKKGSLSNYVSGAGFIAHIIFLIIVPLFLLGLLIRYRRNLFRLAPSAVGVSQTHLHLRWKDRAEETIAWADIVTILPRTVPMATQHRKMDLTLINSVWVIRTRLGLAREAFLAGVAGMYLRNHFDLNNPGAARHRDNNPWVMQHEMDVSSRMVQQMPVHQPYQQQPVQQPFQQAQFPPTRQPGQSQPQQQGQSPSTGPEGQGQPWQPRQPPGANP